ncbi:hypothetical protein [Paenibacillus sp. GCM10027626]|uniref:hypothetical protein n=1 Tax=Paenibacillus sp. GCM10027626 TaxID=3273411 RepID=UPI003635FEDE
MNTTVPNLWDCLLLTLVLLVSGLSLHLVTNAEAYRTARIRMAVIALYGLFCLGISLLFTLSGLFQ